MIILSGLILFLAVLVAIPSFVLLTEVLAAIVLSRCKDAPPGTDFTRPRVAVLIPAFNESKRILPTIGDVKTQLLLGDRLIVVADNCTDDTAEVASAAGAEVVVRNDPQKVGKGYALDAGAKYLATSGVDVIIIVDADCRLGDKAVKLLAQSCAITGRPSQALYLMIAPDRSEINHRVSELALLVKNYVRALGLRALNLPCQLTGTGMAFPAQILFAANLATGGIVEDLDLGLELALAGHPPIFCPAATVTSEFPSSVKGTLNQRQRWEHGYLHTMWTALIRLLSIAISRRNFGLFFLTLDLMVPPLTLFGFLLIGLSILAVFDAYFSHSFAALVISVTASMAYVAALFLAWFKYGRHIIGLESVGMLGGYVRTKIRMYLDILSKGIISEWIRTDRGGPDS